jgi:hypothetical protein
MEPYPFTEEKVDNVYIRTFDHSLENEELKWHRDLEDRIVEVVGETNWKFQFDNQLPIDLSGKIFVPKKSWHRAIKGDGDLVVKITKLN